MSILRIFFFFLCFTNENGVVFPGNRGKREAGQYYEEVEQVTWERLGRILSGQKPQAVTARHCKQTETGGRVGQLLLLLLVEDKARKKMWNEVVADEVDGNLHSHSYRLQDGFSSVPSDCSSDLKVQNLIADQVEGM